MTDNVTCFMILTFMSSEKKQFYSHPSRPLPTTYTLLASQQDTHTTLYSTHNSRHISQEPVKVLKAI
jgi:hypothetical protein